MVYEVSKVGKGRFAAVVDGVVASEHPTKKLAHAAVEALVAAAELAAKLAAAAPAAAPAAKLTPEERAERFKAGAAKAWVTRRAKTDPSASAKLAWVKIRANRAAKAAAEAAAGAAAPVAPVAG